MIMKKITAVCFLFLALLLGLQAQQNGNRPSPSASAEASLGDLTVLIDYNAPSVRGRTIWGVLVPYNRVWRTGANEATTFEVSKDVLVEGQPLPAGQYALFTIPGEDEWTIILNKEAKQWGAYNYKAEQDALRVTATPAEASEFTEKMTFLIDVAEDEQSAAVTFKWEKLMVTFSVASAN
jgi:hypothetical protein